MGLSQHFDFSLKHSTEADPSELPPDAISFGRSEPEEVYSSEGLVVVVDKRALERECLVRGLIEHNPALNITAVGSLEEFRNLPTDAHTSAILVVLGARKVSDEGVRSELSHFLSEVDAIPVIVVAEFRRAGRDSRRTRTWRSRVHPDKCECEGRGRGHRSCSRRRNLCTRQQHLEAARGHPRGFKQHQPNIVRHVYQTRSRCRGSAQTGQAKQDNRLRTQHVREHRQGSCSQHHEKAKGDQPHRGSIQDQRDGRLDVVHFEVRMISVSRSERTSKSKRPRDQGCRGFDRLHRY